MRLGPTAVVDRDKGRTVLCHEDKISKMTEVTATAAVLETCFELEVCIRLSVQVARKMGSLTCTSHPNRS